MKKFHFSRIFDSTPNTVSAKKQNVLIMWRVKSEMYELRKPLCFLINGTNYENFATPITGKVKNKTELQWTRKNFRKTCAKFHKNFLSQILLIRPGGPIFHKISLQVRRYRLRGFHMKRLTWGEIFLTMNRSRIQYSQPSFFWTVPALIWVLCERCESKSFELPSEVLSEMQEVVWWHYLQLYDL